MKKLKAIIVSALATLSVAVWGAVPAYMVYADEVTEMTEISSGFDEISIESVVGEESLVASDTVENTVDYTASYYAQTSENEGVRFDFIDESTVVCVMYVEGVEVGTLNATYQRVDNIVDIYVLDEWFGAFKLNGDGTASDVSWWEDYNDEDIPLQSTVSEDMLDNSPIIDENIDRYLQPVLCAGAGLVGTLIIVLIVLFFGKKIKNEAKELLGWIKAKHLEFESEESKLIAIEEDIRSTYEKLEELQQRNSSEYTAVVAMVKDLMSKVLKKNADTLNLTKAHYGEIMKILEMIAVGNSELVRKGIADDIVKKVEETHKE